MSTVLRITDYALAFRLRGRRTLQALSGIDLELDQGEVLGIVGESGSGKTTLSWSIMRYLAANAIEEHGDIQFLGRSLLQMSRREIERLRGGQLGMIFQNPGTALNPTLPIGDQIVESLTLHRHMNRRQAYDCAIQILADVDIKDPPALLRRYPHQASGGEKQRILIATAFACEPQCLIFDEPTTALDVISADQVLRIFHRLRERTGVAALYISHDLALVAKTADRILVLEAGRPVETAPANQLFSHPANTYTRTLVQSVVDPDHRLLATEDVAGADCMVLKGLGVHYDRQSTLDTLLRRKPSLTTALQPLNLTLKKGEILGVVGESGSGKSSLARALLGLVPFQGEIQFDGKTYAKTAQMTANYRRRLQLIFQHPDASLNPRQKISTLLTRPLRLYPHPAPSSQHDERSLIAAMLERVGLSASLLDRYPHELSGGQKQRVAIARAFLAQPDIIICDEITSALDVSAQAKVIERLLELRREQNISYLFITHDINLVRQIAHRIVVLYRGRLVETLSVALGPLQVQDAYTKALLKATSLPAGRFEQSKRPATAS